MLPFFATFSLAQVIPANLEARQPAQELIIQKQEIRKLPGSLDEIPVFNSNSPEVIQDEGILLSTFPPDRKAVPDAHLNLPLEGKFDLFAHHIARGKTPQDWQPIYQGAIVYNPGNRSVSINIVQAASYVTNPDAPFLDLPSYVENPFGDIFSGPGSRLMTDILKGRSQLRFPQQIIIPPRQSRMLYSLPIMLGNARSTFMRLESNGQVYIATLAMRAPIAAPDNSSIAETGKQKQQLDNLKPDSLNPSKPSKSFIASYREPTLQEWENFLDTANLAGPRDLAPTPLEDEDVVDEFIYGRVAGVARGSQWSADLVDSSDAKYLTIPKAGKSFSYPLSTVNANTLGTGQVQSAPLLVRYADTAYLAHGNYGVRYHLRLPLFNDTDEKQTVTISLQTPLKNERQKDELFFRQSPTGQIFFRGTVRVKYLDDQGISRTRAVHLVQREGQQGQPLVTLHLRPEENRLVEVDFFYPPDATPPQVLSVNTVKD